MLHVSFCPPANEHNASSLQVWNNVSKTTPENLSKILPGHAITTSSALLMGQNNI